MRFKKYLRLIFPDRECSNVFDIDYSRLEESEKEAIIFDLDNTLSTWNDKNLTEDVLKLLSDLDEMGFKLGILTNSKPEGLKEIKEKSDCPVISNASKPLSKGFEELLSRLNVDPEDSVMVGDQIFTDMLGANRLSMEIILVIPINPGEEFILTRVNRFGKRIILKIRSLCSRPKWKKTV